MARRLVLLLMLLSAMSANAGVPLPPIPAARLAALKASVRDEARRASTWRWAWVAGYGAATLGQLAPLAFLRDEALTVDFTVGAVSSAVGVAMLLLLPLELSRNAEELLDQPDTEEGLARAETLARLDAEDEARNVSWVAHVGNAVINMTVALVLGFGWQHWDSAAISYGLGIALGELTILTQPTGLAEALRVVPMVSATGGGLRLVGTF